MGLCRVFVLVPIGAPANVLSWAQEISQSPAMDSCSCQLPTASSLFYKIADALLVILTLVNEGSAGFYEDEDQVWPGFVISYRSQMRQEG